MTDVPLQFQPGVGVKKLRPGDFNDSDLTYVGPGALTVVFVAEEDPYIGALIVRAASNGPDSMYLDSAVGRSWVRIVKLG